MSARDRLRDMTRSRVQAIHRLALQRVQQLLEGSEGEAMEVVSVVAVSGVRCPLCGRSFTTLFGLKYHFKTAHSAQLSTCPICGKQCKSSNGLTRHCARMMRLGCAEHGALYYLLATGAWISKRLGAFKREVLNMLRSGGFKLG